MGSVSLQDHHTETEIRMHRYFVIALALLASTTTSAVAQAPRAAPVRTDVPVRTVVLYSSGVGYFEHAGTVRGTGATELRFKTTQINDILKSLVLRDDGGGRVNSITYPSQDLGPVGISLEPDVYAERLRERLAIGLGARHTECGTSSPFASEAQTSACFG